MVCSGELLLPGMQFIVVGVISKPYCYYKVRHLIIAGGSRSGKWGCRLRNFCLVSDWGGV